MVKISGYAKIGKSGYIGFYWRKPKNQYHAYGNLYMFWHHMNYIRVDFGRFWGICCWDIPKLLKIWFAFKTHYKQKYGNFGNAYTPKTPQIDSDVVPMMPEYISGGVCMICICAWKISETVILGWAHLIFEGPVDRSWRARTRAFHLLFIVYGEKSLG